MRSKNFNKCPSCGTDVGHYMSRCPGCGYEEVIANRFCPPNDWNPCDICINRAKKNQEWPCSHCKHNLTHVEV